jgi:peptidoglycan/LPS O-acetylase OafA/YrhL
MGLFRRKREQVAAAPEDVDAEQDIAAEVAEPEPEAEIEPPRRRPVRRLPFSVRPMALLAVIIVIAIGVLLLLYQQNQLPAEVLVWWPLAMIIPGILWFLISLARRSGNGLLAGAALVGVGISLQLSTLSTYEARSTLVGIMLISTGTAILVRGLLMGRQPIRS